MTIDEKCSVFIDLNLNYEYAQNDQILYEDLTRIFGDVDQKEFTQLKKLCGEDLKDIQKYRNIFLRKKYITEKNKETQIIEKKENIQFEFSSLREFYEWFKEQSSTCCYCGVSQADICIDEKNPLKNQNSPYQRLKRKTRGVSLEIERVVTFSGKSPKISYDANVYSKENCRLACHVCNNAKSDFISAQEFRPIAEGINQFWSKQLGRKIPMPEEVYKKFSI